MDSMADQRLFKKGLQRDLRTKQSGTVRVSFVDNTYDHSMTAIVTVFLLLVSQALPLPGFEQSVQ